jgi:ketosteroid isomerase-like protein
LKGGFTVELAKAKLAQATVAALLLFVGPVQAQEPCDTAGPAFSAISHILAEIDRAFGTGDPTIVAEVVTEDVVWMPPEKPALHGRPAVEEYYRDLFAELHGRFTEITHSMAAREVCVCGGWAMARGTFELTLILPAVPEPIKVTGKNVHAYRQQPDGSWLISSDIWNTDAPVRRGPPGGF